MFKIWKWLFNPDWFTLQFGGGGGGGSSAPASQTQVADLPEWAKPYAKETLGKASALTNIGQNPYQQYTGERIAGFDPMQEQAMRTAASPEEFGKQVQGYMSPYMQNVVDVQKREAMRSAGILGAQQQARATGAGAFGGYREGIQRAEDNRNLMRQMGDIQAMGSQRAFEQGTEQARMAQGLQMQYGGMRQGLEQQRLGQSYQDFMNQQRYPYQQLEFMSNILRGTPMGTVQTMYQAPPSAMQNIASLGLGAYGMKQLGMFAKGGSVTDEGNVKRIVDDLSDTQLAQAKQAARAREDVARLQAIAKEEAMRASERKGFAAMYNALPGNVQDRMAGGGIVAFNGEGNSLVEDEFGFVGAEGDLRVVPEELNQESAGDSNRYGRALDLALDRIEAISAYKPTPYTPAELNEIVNQRFEQEKKLAGDSPYGAFERYLAEAEGGRPQALQQAKGLAALKAASAILQPGGTMRGLGAAGEAFAGVYGTALQADRAEKRALASMKFNLADAQRKERMGMAKSAREAASEAVKNRQAAERAHIQKLGIQAQAAGRTAQAAKPTAQKAPSEAKAAEQYGKALLAYKKDPTPENKMAMEAWKDAVQESKTSDIGDTRMAAILAGISGQQGVADLRAQIDAMRIDQQTRADINKRLTDATYSPEYMALKTPAERKAFIDNLERELVGKAGQPIVPRPGAGAASPRPGAGAAPAAAPAALPAGLNNDNASTLLTVGQIYQTARGPARWTGTGFTPVPAR